MNAPHIHGCARACLLGLALAFACPQANVSSAQASARTPPRDPPPSHDSHPRHSTRVVIPDAPRIATLYADGSRIVVPIEHVWRPMCFGQAGEISHDQLNALALDVAARRNERIEQEPDAPPAGPLGGPPDEGGIAGDGLNLEFIVDASVPAEAVDALDRVEAYYESLFSDDVVARINIEFADLSGSVLGATGAPYTNVTWTTSRIGLRNDMDDSDVIQDFLPSGSKLPVRYNGNSAFITQESRVFWTVANFNAAVGFVGGDAGDMQFNENINWDFDPDDGVSGYSFVDVIIHEVGHVLGFASGVDFRDHDVESLDIYRFQRTDSGFDWNPDNYAEFQTTPRTVSYNLPDNNVISDIIIAQYKMEDGFPFQGSHFKDKIPSFGVMDPVLGQGETFAPAFLRSADKRMFDAIGWDR